MIPHLFFSQLVVLGLLWLFVMLSMAWPSPGVVKQQRPATPMTPSGKPSKDPKPFPGLTRKPHCVACAQRTTQPQLPCEVKIFMRPCGDSTSGAPRAALGIRLGHQPHLPHEAPGMG
jgi:hypothetical protein